MPPSVPLLADRRCGAAPLHMMNMHQYSKLARRMRETIRKDPTGWATACGIQLRPYQAKIALAIKDSIIHKKGLTFVVILPRQSGKNEVQRHLFGWLLFRAAERGGTIVSVAPTFKPQTINAMERMRLTLDDNMATRGQWHSSAGFIFRFHKARLQFFSGEHTVKSGGRDGGPAAERGRGAGHRAGRSSTRSSTR